MTTIAPAHAGGQGITFGDVGAGVGGGLATAAVGVVGGAAAGIFLGDKMWKGGPGAGLGLLAGGIVGGITGGAAAVATSGTIMAMRSPDRDLTKPGAIAGAIGGGLAGAALGMGGDWKATLFSGGIGAVLGAVGGAVGGSLAD
ncbi:MAG: hypothetical protein JWL76_1881 [Thermoleophilia bacterium]|nr:hypothetical protein [Thermoleophilia bacterium]